MPTDEAVPERCLVSAETAHQLKSRGEITKARSILGLVSNANMSRGELRPHVEEISD